MAFFAGLFCPAFVWVAPMANPKAQFRRLTASEQLVLEHLQVRLLTTPDELARCDELISEHHYLQNCTLVGEHR